MDNAEYASTESSQETDVMGASSPDFVWYCGCCGQRLEGARSEESMWCEPCEVHLAPPFWPEGQRREPWDRTWYAQHKEDCPLSGPLTTADEVDQMFADHLHAASGEPVCDAMQTQRTTHNDALHPQNDALHPSYRGSGTESYDHRA